MVRSLRRLGGMVTLFLVLAFLAGGCGQITNSPAVSGEGKTGKLVIKAQMASTSGAGIQSLRYPIASYQLMLTQGTKVIETEFAANNEISVEVDPGTWTILLSATDTEGIQGYSGNNTVEVQAGATAQANVYLLPKPATVNVTADLTALFAAGSAPSYVTVENSENTSIYRIDGFSSQSMAKTVALSLAAPRTVDLTVRAYAADATLLAKQVLTGFPIWPGETIDVVWRADTAQASNGTMTVAATFVEPYDPPTEFSATWNNTTQMLDLSWVAPADAQPDLYSYRYVFEAQTSDAVPYSTWVTYRPVEWGDVTTISKQVPDAWRGTTVNLRMYANKDAQYETPRYSIASDSVSVDIPAL